VGGRIKNENGIKDSVVCAKALCYCQGGWMDERQIDWIAGERELCRTLTGRNMWLNLKG